MYDVTLSHRGTIRVLGSEYQPITYPPASAFKCPISWLRQAFTMPVHKKAISPRPPPKGKSSLPEGQTKTTKVRHYADMTRLNDLYESHGSMLKKRDMEFKRRREELNRKSVASCTFQPSINRHRRVKKNAHSTHDETVSKRWSVITEREKHLLEEFKNEKSMVPLNVDAGDMVTIVEKRVGESKYWCRVIFREMEGIIPMRCLPQYSGFDRLYEKGMKAQKERDSKHKLSLAKPKGVKECTFQPDLLTRKDANGRYWLSKVGAGASAPKTVLATGHVSHNKSPKTKHLPFSNTASSMSKWRPNPPPNGRSKVLHNGSITKRKNVLDHKNYDPMKSHLQQNSYLNRKLSPTSKFKYGVNRSIELPYWDERAMAMEKAKDNVLDFSNAMKKIFETTGANANIKNQDTLNHGPIGQTLAIEELKRLETLNGLEAELLRTEFVTATEQITDELKSLRFQLSQQHEELVSQTPAAIQKNLQENPHLVRAARSNLKFLKAKVSPHKSPSPPKLRRLSPSKQSSPANNHTVPSAHAVSFSVKRGNQAPVSHENRSNKHEKIEMSPLTAGKRHQNYVKKYRKGVLKSLNKRIGGF